MTLSSNGGHWRRTAHRFANSILCVVLLIFKEKTARNFEKSVPCVNCKEATWHCVKNCGNNWRMDNMPYITTKELCRALRVSVNTVTQWKREGCPHFLIGHAGGRGCRARFELDKVKAWLEARTKADKVQDTTTAPQDTPTTDRADRMEQSRAAVARLEARQAAKNRKGMK